ncbi:MAG: DUF167 domain-containing protein [Candidatus Nealsonbacteria bacterium]|nr:DUF167 domain-containing protein [Candidatus Nealsonbacteria bacterium]
MLIKVKVFPGSKKEEVLKKTEDSFEVWVKEKPVMGLANKAVIDALARYFSTSAANVRLVRGFRERNKVFEINGVFKVV